MTHVLCVWNDSKTLWNRHTHEPKNIIYLSQSYRVFLYSLSHSGWISPSLKYRAFSPSEKWNGILIRGSFRLSQLSWLMVFNNFIYSCEGCKGFFKRTVRKDLSYACREEKSCIIDKRQRNRCQYCRYQKCLAMGMKREAVQEERQRTKDRDQSEVESTSSLHADMPVERILEAEKRVECKTEHQGNYEVRVWSVYSSNFVKTNKTLSWHFQNAVTNICNATNKQLFQLVEWAKHIPHFTSLPLEDQVVLLRAGWNELLIAAFSHRSIEVKDGIVLATGLTVHGDSARQAGVGSIFERVLTELVSKMREIKMDKTELGCLRSIILFNPEVRALKSRQEVELLREKVYAALEEYTRAVKPDEPGRFAKLLLRLPSLRSISLKCLEHLFFFRLPGDVPIDNFLIEMLETSSDP